MESTQGWQFSQNFVSMETDGGQERLHCNYALVGLDDTRKNLLLRVALPVLAAEEKRIYSLTDAEAIAELDALKALQDKQFSKVEPNPS